MSGWASVKLAAELKARVDAVRGEVPLARWVAGAVESRLAAQGAVSSSAVPREYRDRPARAESRPVDPLAARQAALNKGKGM